MHLNIFVSQKCFVYCKGCYSFSRVEKNGQSLDTDEIVKFLKYAYKKGIKKVTFCGGDPLTRKDIMVLLKKVKKIGYSITLDTVGTALIKNIEKNKQIIIKKIDASQIANLVDVIGIPIDGSTDKIFKLFRNTNSNLLKEQIEICNLLHNYDANICINTVVHKGNLDDAIDLGTLMNSMDYINKWQIFQFEPAGKYGLINKSMFEITDEEFNDYKLKVLSVLNNPAKVQFKKCEMRKNLYMMVDNSGNAWIPSYSASFENSNKKSDYRQIVGNITNTKDWDKILFYCLEKQNGGKK